jgi:hypothetical protein
MKCPSCGATGQGKFCSSCGAKFSSAGACSSCGASLSAGARFCHACGATVGGSGSASRQTTAAWAIAAAALVALLIVLAATQLRRAPANEFGAVPPIPAAAGPVDLTTLTPRESADRLFDRVMFASQRGVQDTALFFAPMALQAYGFLGDLDPDARYHVGLINIVLGNHDAALAQADSLARSVPTHLYAAVLRAEVAETQGDTDALHRAWRTFRDNYEAEIAAARPEYAAHPAVLEPLRERIRQELGDSVGGS